MTPPRSARAHVTPEPGDIVKYWDNGFRWGICHRIVTRGKYKAYVEVYRMNQKVRVHPDHVHAVERTT